MGEQGQRPISRWDEGKARPAAVALPYCSCQRGLTLSAGVSVHLGLCLKTFGCPISRSDLWESKSKHLLVVRDHQCLSSTWARGHFLGSFHAEKQETWVVFSSPPAEQPRIYHRTLATEGWQHPTSSSGTLNTDKSHYGNRKRCSKPRLLLTVFTIQASTSVLQSIWSQSKTCKKNKDGGFDANLTIPCWIAITQKFEGKEKQETREQHMISYSKAL